MTARFVAGDHPKLQWTLIDSESKARLDLTSSTVKLRFKIGASPAQERDMVVLAPPTNGVVEYQFQDNELTEGSLECEAVVTSAGKQFTMQTTVKIPVRARLV